MYTTGFYAAVLGVLFVLLSARTLILRRRLRIPIGDGGNRQLLRAIRVHSNFAEYVPFSLLLIYLAEIQGASVMFVHGTCIALLLGRLSHVVGVSREPENYWFRIVGIALTFAAILSASRFLLVGYVKHMGA